MAPKRLAEFTLDPRRDLLWTRSSARGEDIPPGRAATNFTSEKAVSDKLSVWFPAHVWSCVYILYIYVCIYTYIYTCVYIYIYIYIYVCIVQYPYVICVFIKCFFDSFITLLISLYTHPYMGKKTWNNIELNVGF